MVQKSRKSGTDYPIQNLENARNRADYLNTDLENVQNGADYEDKGIENMLNGAACLDHCCNFGSYQTRLSAIITNSVDQSLHLLGLDLYLIQSHENNLIFSAYYGDQVPRFSICSVSTVCQSSAVNLRARSVPSGCQSPVCTFSAYYRQIAYCSDWYPEHL